MGFFDDILSITHPGTRLFGFGDDDESSGGPGYTIRDGRVYLNSIPGDVGIPLSTIPGTDASPTPGNYRTLAEQVRVVNDLLPYYTKAISGQLGALQQAELDSAKQTSPGYAQLMTELYQKYGPQLNQIGSDIVRQNALNQAATDRDVLKGPGGETVKAAYDTAQIFDKPYYDTRELTAGRLADLLKSIDLSGGLSPTERREIEQSLAIQGGRRGTYNAPSATDTVADAMTYGSAGRTRVLENQNELSKAIAASSAFLPSAKSGVDVFQVATGKPSMPNTGESKFTGVTKTDPGAATNLASSLLSTGNANASNALAWEMNKANIDANKKDWLDQFVQFTSGIGNLTSAAGGIAGMCWVAREVYGVDNPRWILFRDWLATDAPMWLFKSYVRYGERFAQFIHNKPILKFIIRKLMDTKTK